VKREPNAEQAPPVVNPSPGRRPFEITGFSIVFLILGLLYLITAVILLACGDDPTRLVMPAVAHAVKGMLLLAAGAGLWRTSRWAVLGYAMFILVRQALRFQSEVLEGDTLTIASYIIFCAANAVFGHYLWRLVSRYSTRSRGIEETRA
jgi:hypothetical protein